MLMAMMVTVSSFAQDASLQQGAVSPSGRAENVETIYTMILVICAAAFLIVIIYALTSAVKALSFQLSS